MNTPSWTVERIDNDAVLLKNDRGEQVTLPKEALSEIAKALLNELLSPSPKA